MEEIGQIFTPCSCLFLAEICCFLETNFSFQPWIILLLIDESICCDVLIRVILLKGVFLSVSVLLSQCPTQWHPPHQVPQTLVWVRHRPRPLRTLWLWNAGDDTPTQAYSSSLFPLTTDSTQCLLWGHDKTKTLQNSIHFVPVSVDSYCWNLIAPSVMAHGRRPHTYGLDSCLRKHEELSVSHHRAPSLVCFYFISLPPLCSCAFPPSPVWSGCRGQRSRVCRNYLRWNRFVKLLMHTSLLHMFSRKLSSLSTVSVFGLF